MKQTLLALLALATFTAHAQDGDSRPSVERSQFSIQAGLLGVWFNHELGLGRKIALRSEVGIEPFTVTEDNGSTVNSEIIFTPVLVIEPKWYYNLDRRARRGRNTSKNSGNSFGILAHYNASFFKLGNDNVPDPDHLAMGLKYTIRRVYGKHFNFETGFTGGTIFYVGNDPYYKSASQPFIDVTVRLGYAF